MPTTLGREVSGQGIAIYAVVAGLHFGMLMFLLCDPLASDPMPARRAVAARDAIRIRFLRHPLPASMPPVPPPPALPQQRKPTSAVISRRALPAPGHLASATNRRPEPAPATAVPADREPTYIAGGGRFTAVPVVPRSSTIHLPGSAQPIVKGLHMVDPRTQGVAGAARRLQAILDAPDPRCVDVDVWRGMSVRELLDRHISPEAVESTAETHHCGPPKRRRSPALTMRLLPASY